MGGLDRSNSTLSHRSDPPVMAYIAAWPRSLARSGGRQCPEGLEAKRACRCHGSAVHVIVAPTGEIEKGPPQRGMKETPPSRWGEWAVRRWPKPSLPSGFDGR